MAGGWGERLWPLSRRNYPKQLLKIMDDRKSLLQVTIYRFLKKFPIEDIYVLTNPSLFHLVKLQLSELNPFLGGQIILEPEKKNTAPAIALAMKFFETQDEKKENECFLFCPSDSYMSPEENFLHLIDQAEEIASHGQIVTFGVTPYKPETGYGYIKVQDNHKVKEFIEKPNLVDAERFIRDGNYLWNCGIFLFTMKCFFDELRMHAPKIFLLVQGSYVEATKNFSQMPNISIDHALMEKSRNISAILTDLVWSDVGSWDSLYDLNEKDEDGNVHNGEIFSFDSKNNFIFSQRRQMITSSIENLVIIDTKDVLFVGNQKASQGIKEIIHQLKESGNSELLNHAKIYKPWGFFEILHHENSYKVKKIHVYPGQKLSLQYHHHRSEHWVIVRGQAFITKEELQKTLDIGDSIFIEKDEIHRIEALSNAPLEIIGTQIGEKLDEEDMVNDEYEELILSYLHCSQSI